MRKLYILLALLIIYAVATIYIVPAFSDKQQIAAGIEGTVKEITGRDVIFSGETTSRYFPLPHYVIPAIKVKNAEGILPEFMLETGEVSIRPSVLSLLMLKPKMAKAIITAPVLHINTADRKPVEIDFLNAEITESGAVKGNFAGAISLEAKFGKYTATENKLPVAGSVSAGAAKIAFDGTIANPGQNPVFSGKISADINTLPKIIAGYTGIVDKLPTPLLEERFTINGKGEASALGVKITNSETTFIGSKGIGSLEFRPNDGSGPLIGIAIRMDKIDLDALNAQPDNKNPEKAETKTEIQPLPDTLAVVLDVAIGEVNYRKQKINDVRLKATLTKDSQVVDDFSFGFPGNSRMEISVIPSTDQSGQGTQLNGHIKLYGDNLGEFTEYFSKFGFTTPKINLENFFAESDFVMTAEKIYLPDMDILLTDANLKGKALLDRTGKNFEAIIQAASLDLDKILSTIELAVPENSTASGAAQNLTAFDSLRTFPYKIRVAFAADDMNYSGDRYTKAGGEFEANGGVLTTRFEGKSQLSGDMKTAIKIYASGLKPTFQGSIIADRLTLNDFIALREKLENVIYFNGEKPAAPAPRFDIDVAEAKIWPTAALNFSGANFMDGTLEINAKTFTIGKLEFHDLSATAKMQDGILSVDPFKAGLFGGTLDLKANISTRGRPDASITYALANADLKPALALIAKTDRISGHFGISGSASFSGFNINDWMSQAQGSAALVIRGIEMSGFDLKEIYERLANMKTPNAYDTFMQNAFSTGATKFEFFGGDLFLNNGILSAKDLTLRSAYINKGTFAAKLNLATLNMDSTLNISCLTQDSHGIPIVFSMRGTIDDSQGRWDYSAFKPYWQAKALEKTKS